MGPTQTTVFWVVGAVGLSPLARGNQRGRRALARPIPARAGQPWCYRPTACLPRAYPRSRGATQHFFGVIAGSKGLSPLARGNLSGTIISGRPFGPIPARAGQPARNLSHGGYLRAYPRSRGATWSGNSLRWRNHGLSPLARGNRHHLIHLVDHLGPIPARAGQPPPAPSKSPPTWAYPRSRRATSSASSSRPAALGLSPLARGNLDRDLDAVAQLGPIPARAGQPQDVALSSASAWAYPRSRGATSVRSPGGCRRWGLSPLARGNQRLDHQPARWPGPIPARAGQPEGL